MKDDLNLVVMLTYNDLTVENAYDVFDKCKNSGAELWGFKEEPLPIAEMKRIFDYMKDCGKTTFLEVVAYTENECIEGAKMAVACGCDILMGTVYSDKVNDFCKAHSLKYMPFVGDIVGRPSILKGSIDGMISEAKAYLEKGVYGFDLLGYRYVGDEKELISRFVDEVDAPVCVAGSVNSYQRLDELKACKPWAFTIGSAFFDNDFDGSIDEQINKVIDYIGE